MRLGSCLAIATDGAPSTSKCPLWLEKKRRHAAVVSEMLERVRLLVVLLDRLPLKIMPWRIG
jgi:hypothetical protein